VDIVFGAVLLFWFVLSIVAHIPSALFRKLRSFDCFGLLPVWSFFAPNPATHDNRVFLRAITKAGYSEWKPLKIPVAHHVNRALWNPYRRNRKAISDVVSVLTQRPRELTARARQLDIPYLLLLNHIAHLRHADDTIGIQFALLAFPSEPARPEVWFVSGVHKLKTPVNANGT
jgi:hypothetical protein